VRSAWDAIISEAVGTFLFFFIGMGAAVAVNAGRLEVALAHGLVLAVLVSALGVVSGAHFNPAVTFGVWVSGNIEARRAIAYVLAQCIGGLLAAIALLGVYPASSGLGLPVLGEGIDSIEGFFIEAALTLILVIAVFGTAVDPRAPKVGGLMIGLAVAADILMGGPLTGAAMNPARWLAPAVAPGHYENAHVWILGPLVGALVAALLYRFRWSREADLDRSPGDPTPEDDVR
jgi:MIP family channel proteins